MSDSSNDSESSESNVCPPTFLFLDEEGRPMEFIICHKNLEQRKKYTKIIKDRTGCVFSHLRDFGSHTVVLVEDDAKFWSHNRDVFKVSYIDECLKQESIIEIGKFIHYPSAELVPDFPYMDIFYYRKFGWNNIPDKYKLPPGPSSSEEEDVTEVTEENTNIPTEPENKKPPGPSSNEEEDVTEVTEENTNIPTEPENKKPPCPSTSGVEDVTKVTKENTKIPTEPANKKTRMAYTMTEKEAIIKYIVEHDVYTYVKGVSIWRNMEQENICPRRTWQSMKEHTLKTLAKELHLFKFLTPDEKNNLRIVLTGK